jgi:HEAT repeat protein
VWLNQITSSQWLVAAFLAFLLLLAILYATGVLGWILYGLRRLILAVVSGGFAIWRRWLGWAPWPVFLTLVVAVHAAAWSVEARDSVGALAGGFVILFLGVVACLAYMHIDLERYEVAHGHKVLHKPMMGQEVAVDLVGYGQRVGTPLLIVATLAVISGFAMFNQGLFQTVARHWWRSATVDNADDAFDIVPPTYLDFLAYSLINVFRIVDLVDLAGTYNYVHISYVRQLRWPASTLLILFKLFFVSVLLEQIYSAVRRGNMLTATIQDVWNPHTVISQRAQALLEQHGLEAVAPLLDSVRLTAFVSPEQRCRLAAIVADTGPTAVPILVKRLRDSHPEVRAVSVAALGQLQAVQCLPRMAYLLNDADESVRLNLAGAVYSLCEGGARRVETQARLARLRSRLWWRVGRDRQGAASRLLALVSGLLRDPSAAVRARATQAAGLLGPAAAAAASHLASLLRDADESVRVEAAAALGRIGALSDDARVALEALLSEPNPALKRAAAVALAAGKAKASIPKLVALLNDRDDAVREAAAEAIRQMGVVPEETTPALASGLESPDNVVRAKTAEALGTLGEAAPQGTRLLLEALSDANDHVRAKAAAALAKVGPAAGDAVPALRGALRDTDHQVAARAAEALGQIGDIALPALAGLIEATKHVSAVVRGEAVAALGKLGRGVDPSHALHTELREALDRSCDDPDAGVRARAVDAVAASGGDTACVLVHVQSAFQDADPEVRAAAVRSLAQCPGDTPGIQAALLTALGDTNDHVQSEAARMAGQLGLAAPAVVAAVSRLLEDDTSAVQVEAATALGKLERHAVAAEQALMGALKTGEASVREEALRALVKIQSPHALEAFAAGLRDAERSVRVVASAGFIKAPALPVGTMQILVEALKDPDAQVRANAAQALARLETLPEEAVAVLVDCTTDPDDGLRLQALRALKKAPPDAGVAAVFRRLLDDSNPPVAAEAARCLEGNGQAGNERSAARAAPVGSASRRSAAVELPFD